LTIPATRRKRPRRRRWPQRLRSARLDHGGGRPRAAHLLGCSSFTERKT